MSTKEPFPESLYCCAHENFVKVMWEASCGSFPEQAYIVSINGTPIKESERPIRQVSKGAHRND